MSNKLKNYLYNSISFVKNYKKYFSLGLIAIAIILLFVPTTYAIGLRIGNIFRHITWQHSALALSACTAFICFIIYLTALILLGISAFTSKKFNWALFIPFFCSIIHTLLAIAFMYYDFKLRYNYNGYKYIFEDLMKSSNFWIPLAMVIFLSLCFALGRWHTRTTPPIPIEKQAKPKKLSNSERIAELEKQLSELKKDE